MSELIINSELKWIKGFVITGTIISMLFTIFAAIVGINTAFGDVSLFCVGVFYPTIILLVIHNVNINTFLSKVIFQKWGKISRYIFLLHIPLLMGWKYLVYITGINMIGMMPMLLYILLLIAISYAVQWCEYHFGLFPVRSTTLSNYNTANIDRN